MRNPYIRSIATTAATLLAFLSLTPVTADGQAPADDTAKVTPAVGGGAFPICVVLLMTLGLLELAMPLNKDDWSYRHVWAMMPALYFLGLWRAKRRYQ